MTLRPRVLLRRAPSRAVLTALLAPLVAATTLVPAHPAGAAVAQRVQVAGVSASLSSGAASPGADGGTLRASFVLNNRTGTHQDPGRAWVFLVRSDGHSNRVASTATPSLAPAERARVRTTAAVPPRLRPGAYQVLVCLTPRPDGHCRAAKRPVRVAPAHLTSTSSGDSTFASTVEMLSESQDITFTNTGQTRTGAVRLRSLGSPDFLVFFSDCGPSLDPGESCFADVGLLPSDAGTVTGALRLTSARGAQARHELSGTGTFGRVYVAPGRQDFGVVDAGASAQATFDVVNTTDEDLTIDGGDFANHNGFDFDFSGPFSCLSFQVPANGSCTVSVSFTPQAEGPAQDTMIIFGPDGELFVAVSGAGAPGVYPAPQPVRPGRGSFGSR